MVYFDPQRFPPERRDFPDSVFEEMEAWYAGTAQGLSRFHDRYGLTSTQTWRGFARSQSATLVEYGSHVPVAYSIANYMGDLMFGLEPELEVEDDTTQERLEEIIERSGFWAECHKAAVIASIYGGVFIKPCWDTDLVDYPFAIAYSPKNVIPYFRQCRLYEATLWQILNNDDANFDVGDSNTVLRHLEHHSVEDGKAVITHALYKGSVNMLGIAIPLSAHKVTEPWADLQPAPDDSEHRRIVLADHPRILVEYVPNKLPSSMGDEGQSDFYGLTGLMYDLDQVQTSWERDFRTGKNRVLVDKGMLAPQLNRQGSFDLDDEVFVNIPIRGTREGDAPIEQIVFEIRSTDHEIAYLLLYEQIVTGAGLSPQSFGLKIEGTAESGTALRSRKERTLETQSKKRRYWEQPLERLAESLLILDRTVVGSGTAVDRPALEWQPPVLPGLAEVTTAVAAIKTAEAGSTETLVRMLHPDWDDEQVEAEVAEIGNEREEVAELDMTAGMGAGFPTGKPDKAAPAGGNKKDDGKSKEGKKPPPKR